MSYAQLHSFGADEDPLTITATDLEEAKIATRRLFPKPPTDLSKFRDDIRGLEAVWPTGEVCFSGEAFIEVVTPLIALGNKAINLGAELARDGTRKLVAGRYLAISRDLSRDLNGLMGLGGLQATIDETKKEAADRGLSLSGIRVCLEPIGPRDMRSQVLFSLNRIRIALETYQELEDMRPWFAKNAVFDFIFNALFKLGEATVSAAKLVGEPIEDLVNAFNAAMNATLQILKWGTLLGGLYLLWKVLEPEGTRK